MSDVAEKKELVAPQTLKGFQDLLPRQMILRNDVVRKIQGVYERYGFVPTDSPNLEYLVTLIGTGGEEANKSLFRLKSPEGDDAALRFDLTVGFARQVAQYPLEFALPFRRYQIGPVFRADKPDPGRFRQFTQFDIDAAGSASVAVDAEILAAMSEAMRAVGLGGDGTPDSPRRFEIRINNRKLVDALLENAGITSREKAAHVLRVVDKLQKVGLDYIRRELGEGRVDDSGDRIRGVHLGPAVIDQVLAFIAIKGGSRSEVIECLRSGLADSDMTRVALKEMAELAGALAGLGVAEEDAVFDPSLARGLDYYTGPVFEAYFPAAPQFGSVMGGGRYDGLVTRFKDVAIPATGTSIGLDRFLAALNHLGVGPTAGTTVQVLVVAFPGSPVNELLAVASELRRQGIATQVYFKPDVVGGDTLYKGNVKEQLSYANAAGIPVAVLVGEDELKNGTVSIKDLTVGKKQREEIQDRVEYKKAGKAGQRTVPRAELIPNVRGILAAQC